MANPRTDDHRSVIFGSLVMVVVSLVLFFMPLINGLIGGIVGGYLVGNVKRALLAAILPAVLVAIGLWIIFGLFEAPVLGLFAGLAVGMWILITDLALFIGAAIGGGLASSTSARTGPAPSRA
jgi:hypothetical protein